jgi:NAD(P)-dependent dehydrogenase (short-subunit alcohol dehydrogenase family)
MDVKGTVVLITGASSGIGAAAALAFDRAGARVAVAARRAERLERLVERMADALAVPTDLAEPAAAGAMVDATVRHFGRIDVLINNAATLAMAPGDRTSTDDVRRCLETNFIGPMVATNRAVQYMRRRGGGHIINVGSPAAVLGVPFLGPYTASKAALSGWTRSLQAEWEGTGIVVSEYLPGNVATGAQAESELGAIGSDVFEDPIQHPLTRALARQQRPEKIAAGLVDLVRRPRPLMVSSPAVRLGLWLTLLSPVRRALGKKMATAVRRRLGISVFSDRPTVTDAKTPTTNGREEGTDKQARPGRGRAKKAASTTARKRAAGKTSPAKPRRRKAGGTGKEDRDAREQRDGDQ